MTAYGFGVYYYCYSIGNGATAWATGVICLLKDIDDLGVGW